MSDPAIKAALGAAGAELAVRWHPDMPFRQAAAIANAAFLRALPRDGADPACAVLSSEGDAAWWALDLAAAVEEAARDG